MKYRPEYDLKVIGENLRRLREKKSFSVDEVREYLRLGSVQAVYKYEKGKSYPKADTMFALMELYEADLNDIIHKQEDCVFSFRESDSYSYIYGYNAKVIDVGGIDTELEIINIADAGKLQIRRIKRYIEVWQDISRRGIAG